MVASSLFAKLSPSKSIAKMEKVIKIFSPELAKCLDANESNPELRLAQYEENVTLWLWAYPELLGWPRDIKWLFSPVTGNTRYPGDLWGIDSRGTLIIVETKLAKNGRLQDPLIDFVGFETRQKNSKTSTLSTISLEKRWARLFQCEQVYLKSFLSDMRKGRIQTRTASGVVPYSSKRVVIAQWPYLYSQKIARHFIAGSAYRESIKKYLSRRAEAADPSQHFFGVIGTVFGMDVRLSRKGQENYSKLCREIGSHRVHLIAIQPKLLKSCLVELQARTIKAIQSI